jgi:hypothetical protein
MQPYLMPRPCDSRSPTRGEDRLPICASPALPAWESFPVQDRQVLVRVLVQTAQRRIPVRPRLPERGKER